MTGWMQFVITLASMILSLRSIIKVEDLSKALNHLEIAFGEIDKSAEKYEERIDMLKEIIHLKRSIKEWTAVKNFCQFCYLTGAYLTFWVLFVGWLCG